MRRILLLIASTALMVFFCSCGSDEKSDSSSAAIVAADKVKGIVWSLKSLSVNEVNIPIKGNAYLEFKTDNTFVYHEAYFALPKLDSGPCWTVSKGTATVTDTSVTTKTIEEQGRDACKSSDTTESTDVLAVTDTSLTITQKADGATIVMTYEKDASISLDYDALVKAVDSKDKITLNTASDSYIEDENENDNLTLLLTECDLNNNKVDQYFSSEAMGASRIIKMDYGIPALSSWTNDKFTQTDGSSSCNAPGYRSLITSDLQTARASNDFDTLYGCGATCTYSLISETHDADDKYTSVSLSWECINVGINTLANPSWFGNLIDKHVGKAICTNSN